jgi:hypothetical protein
VPDMTHLQGRVAMASGQPAGAHFDMPDVGPGRYARRAPVRVPVVQPVVEQAITVTAAEREDTSHGTG